MDLNTLIAAPMNASTMASALTCPDTRLDSLPDGDPGPRLFKIRAAEAQLRRQSALALLRERYAWRGYQAVSLPTDQTGSRMTLSATEGDLTIGTLTVALDGPQGLPADDAFAAELAALRAEGRRLCEFTRLAIDPVYGSKRVLAALFHVGYITAHRLRDHDTLLLEVNPRHVRYYERMLGCRVIGEPRRHRGVDAPAVLLTADFAYIRAQIGDLGGQPERAGRERTLYPLAFSLREEAHIIERMMAAQPMASTQPS